MTLFRKGVLLAVLHLAIVLSLGAKLLIDRARYPRVWAQTASYDPNLPIRGRYLSVRLQVNADRVYTTPLEESKNLNWWEERRNITLAVEDGHLTALPTDLDTGLYVVRWRVRDQPQVFLEEPVAFFIPEHAADPSHRPPGEQLWIEVTVPKKGPPRPIRLGVMKDGVLTPLTVE